MRYERIGHCPQSLRRFCGGSRAKSGGLRQGASGALLLSLTISSLMYYGDDDEREQTI